MSVHAKWAGGVLLAALFGLIAALWLQEHDARLRADAAQKAGEAQIKALEQQKQSNDAELGTTLADLEKQRQTPATPQEIVVDASKLIPNLPQPLQTVTAPAPHDAKPAADGKPDAPTPQGVLIPEADLPAIKDYSLDCQANAAKLDACTKNAAIDKAQYAALAKERDSWKTAAKGGSLMHRLGKKLKCIAISGAASSFGAWADKQHPAQGALLGAAAGGVGCEIF